MIIIVKEYNNFSSGLLKPTLYQLGRVPVASTLSDTEICRTWSLISYMHDTPVLNY